MIAMRVSGESSPRSWSAFQLVCTTLSTVMRGHSRPKDGVASLAYDPRIHERSQRIQLLPPSPRLIMDCRVKPGNDSW
jgi:hypothetical protein